MNKQEIINWLDVYGIKNYHINDDLVIDVNDDVNICDALLKEIPFQFGKIKGNFYCERNKDY